MSAKLSTPKAGPVTAGPGKAKKPAHAKPKPRPKTASGSWQPSPKAPAAAAEQATPQTPDASHAPHQGRHSKHGKHATPNRDIRLAAQPTLLPTGGAAIAPLSATPPTVQSHPTADVVAPVRIAVPAIETGGISTGPSSQVSMVPPAALLARIYGDLQGPPSFLIAIYKQAESRYHVPWQILAAINSIETNYGRDLSVSSAGAEGWMQFMPETWAHWGVDANHDGKKDPYDPQDAIFAAARYLQRERRAPAPA